MVIFQGNKRVFNKPVEEHISSSTSNRKIELFGVTSYDDVVNAILPILSYQPGDGEATLSINDLDPKSIKYYKNGVISELDTVWVQSNQLYYVIYNGLEFVLYSTTSNGGGGSSVSFNYDENTNTLDIYDQ